MGRLAFKPIADDLSDAPAMDCGVSMKDPIPVPSVKFLSESAEMWPRSGGPGAVISGRNIAPWTVDLPLDAEKITKAGFRYATFG